MAGATNPYNAGYVANGAASIGVPSANQATAPVAAPVVTSSNPTAPVAVKPAAVVAKPAAAKKPTSALEKWLAGDTTYQQQLAEFNSQQQSYNQQYTDSTNQQNQNYNSTKLGMNTQATQDRQNQQYDFAGRGVLTSGVFAQALDQYNTTFNQNMNNLTQGNTQALASDKDQLNNFLRELTLQRNAAKQDAIQRRAESLGI